MGMWCAGEGERLVCLYKAVRDTIEVTFCNTVEKKKRLKVNCKKKYKRAFSSKINNSCFNLDLNFHKWKLHEVCV